MDFNKFLLFGDSITQYSSGRCDSVETALAIDEFSLGAGLGALYNRKLDILVRGYSGYNTRWCLPVLDAILDADRPQGKIVLSTIFFGSNDSVSQGHQCVPLDEFAKNIRTMVTKVVAAGIKPILVTPARVDQELWTQHFQEDKENGYIRSDELYKRYRDQLLELGTELDVPVVDLYSAFENKPGLLSDGIHFTGKGYRVFFEELMHTIANEYPQFAPQALPFHLPYWRDVKDERDVVKALNTHSI